MKRSTLIVHGVAFGIAFLAFGSSHWPPPYNSVGLPNSLYGIGIAAVLLLGPVLRVLSPAGLWQATAILGATAPAAVFARVVVEATLDPTSHNLWPFELLIAALVGFPLAFIAALVGGLIAPWARDRIEAWRSH